jgi:hypothetical protein
VDYRLGKLRSSWAKTEEKGLICEDLYRWEDQHGILENHRGSLAKMLAAPWLTVT